MVPPSSNRISRVPPYSSSVIDSCFRIQGYHLLWLTIQCHFSRKKLLISGTAYPTYKSHLPIATTHAGYHMTIVFHSSRFAHHYLGNHICFLFLTLLRCFSSSRSLPYPIYSDRDVGHTMCPTGSPIQKPPDHRSIGSSPKLFAAFYAFY